MIDKNDVHDKRRHLGGTLKLLGSKA